jgi:Tfp pilus assembly protein PilF
LPGVIGIVTVLVFLPLLRNGFVAWDDEPNLLDNPNYRGFGWNNLQWMFTTFHHSLYRPLTWMSLAFDHALWGMDPAGYHLTSILIHAVNAVLLFYLIERLLEAGDAAVKPQTVPMKIAAGVGALLFAIHPLRVEPVAWISARNDILSATFFLLTLIFYLRYAFAEGSTRRTWLGASIAAYACSLLAKASGIGLPVVLLILDWYPLRRFGRRSSTPRLGWKLIWEKLPFVVLAAGAALVAVLAKYEAGSMAAVGIYGFGARAVQSAYGLWFYIYKTFLPVELSPLYQVPVDFSGTESWAIAGASLITIMAVSAFLLRERWPAVWASFLFYVVILAPFLGILQSGPQLVADRYSYVSCTSLSLLVGALFLYLWKAHGARFRQVHIALGSVAVMVLAVFSVVSWQQIPIWRDTESLWRHALAIDRESDIAHYNLGRVLARRGDRGAAMAEYREAVRIQPQDSDNHNGVGLLLALEGKYEESLTEFQKAVEINPRYAEGFFNLGRIYAIQRDFQKAEQNYREALRLQPEQAEIHLGLGNILMASGASAEAAEHLEQAVKLNPGLADAHTALARLLVAQGKKAEAEEHYQKALELLKSRATDTSRN